MKYARVAIVWALLGAAGGFVVASALEPLSLSVLAFTVGGAIAGGIFAVVIVLRELGKVPRR